MITSARERSRACRARTGARAIAAAFHATLFVATAAFVPPSDAPPSVVDFAVRVVYPDEALRRVHDRSDECVPWALAGECEINGAFMLADCPLSCATLSPTNAAAHAIAVLELRVELTASSSSSSFSVDAGVERYLKERIVANLLYNNPAWKLSQECTCESGSASDACHEWTTPTHSDPDAVDTEGEPINMCIPKWGSAGPIARTYNPEAPLRNPAFKNEVAFTFPCDARDVDADADRSRLEECGLLAEEEAAFRMYDLNADNFTAALMAAFDVVDQQSAAIDPADDRAETLAAVRAEVAASSWALRPPLEEKDEKQAEQDERGSENTETVNGKEKQITCL